MIERLQQILGDRHRVERELGHGGMAIVYLAQDLKHGRPVAIKVLRPELAMALGSERFVRETQIAARLQHPHIVPVYDSGASDGVFYYVMPLVEGESLRQLLDREKRLAPARAREIAREVATALEYAHAHDLVHRDIKPENIMISGGQAVVTDFGIARAISAAGGERLTGTGFAVGTLAYMSPEQALADERIDGRTDIYSLGCVLYEMIAGEPPFSGATPQAIMARSLTGPQPRLRAAQRDAPRSLDDAVARAMAQDPAERYSSAGEFARALAQDAPPSFFSDRVRLPVVAGATAALAVLALGAWWIVRPTRAVVAGAETIAVMPFTTSGTGVEFLHEGMMDLLSKNIDGVGGIHAVDPRTVLHRWKKRAGDGDLDRTGALAVGRSSGAGAILMGSVVAAGPSVRMSADLSSTDGTVLARASADGPADNVLNLVDSLSMRLLREIWRSRQPLPSVHLSGITTGSVDAIRSYLLGEQFFRRSQWDSAIVAFRRAVELDSTFALAYYRLAVARGWIGGLGTTEARDASEAAVRHANRLPAREQTLLVAHRLFEETRPAARDTMLAYVQRYPDDAEGWHLLGDIQFHGQSVYGLDLRELYAPFDRSLELDPSFTPTYEHLIDLSLMYGDSTRFFRALSQFESVGRAREADLYRSAGVARFRMPDSLGAVMLRATRERGGVTAMLAVSILRTVDSPPDRLLGLIDTANRLIPTGDPRRPQFLAQKAFLLFGLGRLNEARKVAEALTAISPDMGAGVLQQPIVAGYAPPAYTQAVRAQFADMLKNPAIMNNPNVRYWRTVQLLALNDRAAAREMIRQSLAARIDTVKVPVPMRGLLQGLQGWLSLVEGDTTAGVRQLRAGVRDVGFGGQANGFASPLRFQLAVALAARPETRDEGITRLRFGLGNDPTYMALGNLRLAEALQAKGDRAAAALAYADFVRLWDKADPELQPRVQAAREAIRRLTAEPR